MSNPDAQAELQALKKRVQADKDTINQIKDLNEALQGQLQDRESSRPSSRASGLSENLANAQSVVYLSEKKEVKFFREALQLFFYEWLDELQASLNYRPYTGADKASYIYEQLGGEAKQEIRYRPLSVRKDPECIIEILKEIYGRPQSLTKLQRSFFDRRQREGETVR